MDPPLKRARPRKRHPDDPSSHSSHPSNVGSYWPKLELTLKLKKNYILDLRWSRSQFLESQDVRFPTHNGTILLTAMSTFDKSSLAIMPWIQIQRHTNLWQPWHHLKPTGEATANLQRDSQRHSLVIPIRCGTRRLPRVHGRPFWCLPRLRPDQPDKAIQARVRQSNDLLLTDYSWFQDINLIPPYQPEKPPDQVMQNIQNTLWTWNPDLPVLECRYCISNSCGYRHICFKCKGKHQAKECMSGQQMANLKITEQWKWTADGREVSSGLVCAS